jgi:predicted alpha/beta hydrolase family esterase
MLKSILRIGTLLEFMLATVLAAWLLQLGVALWIALAVAALLPLMVHAIPLGIEFVTGALIDRRPVSRLGLRDAIRVWWQETWRSFTVFNIDQAWRADFPERPLVRDPHRPAVLFVHGYMCNRATWRRWLFGGLPERWNIATVNLEPVYGPVERYAEVLHGAIEKLRAASGTERVTLVGHSMGGLAARAYLRAHGQHAVARVVTIDTPHHGTLFARYAKGHNARQMRSASDYVRGLAQSDEPVEFVCFASHHDNLIVPREGQVIYGSEAVWFEKIGHLAMTASDEVLAKLIEVVERPLPASHAPGAETSRTSTASRF